MVKRINIADGMRFGKGIDSSIDEARGEALLYNSISTGQGGQTVTSELKKIESQESLMESLNISVGASVRYGLLSVDAKMDLAKQHTVNEFSTYMLLNAKIKNPAKFMVNPRLNDQAFAMYQNDPENFRQIFGDSYIESIISGGEFFGLFIFTSRDESTKTQLNAELNASYSGLFAGGSIDASFKKTIDQFSRTTSMEIRAIMSGGKGIENPTSLEDLVNIYAKFNQLVGENPIDHEAVIQEFKFLPLPPGPTWAEQLVRRDTIETCGRYIIEGIKLRGKIDFILSNPAQFENPDLNALKVIRDKNNALIPKWAQRANECSNAVASNIDTACSLAEEGPVVPGEWPKRILVAGDPLDEKWQEIKQFDSKAYLYFRDEYHPVKGNPDYKYDTFNGGRYWIFQKSPDGEGGIFWHPNHGAHVVYGSIFGEYLKRGHCKGSLGYPVTDEETFQGRPFEPPDGLDRISIFEKGALLWDFQTGVVSERSLKSLGLAVDSDDVLLRPIDFLRA